MKDMFKIDQMIAENTDFSSENNFNEIVDQVANKRTIVETAIFESLLSGIKIPHTDLLKESLQDGLKKFITVDVVNMVFEKYEHILNFQHFLPESSIRTPIEDLRYDIETVVNFEFDAVSDLLKEDFEDSKLYGIFRQLKEADMSQDDILLQEDTDILMEKSISMILVSKLTGRYGFISESQNDDYSSMIFNLLNN